MFQDDNGPVHKVSLIITFAAEDLEEVGVELVCIPAWNQALLRDIIARPLTLLWIISCDVLVATVQNLLKGLYRRWGRTIIEKWEQLIIEAHSF